MIKSQINTLGFWISPVMLVAISGFSIFALFNSTNPKDIIPVTALWGLFLILLIPAVLYAKIIIVDPDKETISIIRFYTRQRYVYSFKDFDGYVGLLERPARGQPYRVLYLVKDERFIQKISSFIYSNFAEIEAGLNGLEYFGEKNFHTLRTLKSFLGKGY